MPENTFDIVSKIDPQEVTNAIQQALKEIHTRFDLKDSKSNIELDRKSLSEMAIHEPAAFGAIVEKAKSALPAAAAAA